MASGNGVRAGIIAAVLPCAAGSAWAGEAAAAGGKGWAGWLDPAAVAAVAALVVLAVLSSAERRRRKNQQRDLAPNAGRSAKVTPISVEREPRLPASEKVPSRRAAARQR
jgi:hypothetical protein